MSGKILLDTNAIIYALNAGLTLLPAEYSISIITEMELFSYPKLSEFEKNNIKRLLSHFKIKNINDEIKEMTIQIRKNYGIKLPDSIICATALVSGATLISNDKQLSKIEGLDVLSLEIFLNS
ncbi:MAG: PilT protein domain protein [uncultured Sulfurovum sp.]|uniref:PilT protein domain protein n=1 Tax=uncultured Sulfurovum sp. TaxID=269237 RepID=A0A6S6TWW5_9BACT|nr:MAG: PilT protein domain protein [uncultured Sulfurovum sp.]